MLFVIVVQICCVRAGDLQKADQASGYSCWYSRPDCKPNAFAFKVIEISMSSNFMIARWMPSAGFCRVERHTVDGHRLSAGLTDQAFHRRNHSPIDYCGFDRMKAGRILCMNKKLCLKLASALLNKGDGFSWTFVQPLLVRGRERERLTAR